MKNFLVCAGIGLAGLLYCISVQASCGSTTCAINTNWDEHGVSRPGWSADLRYSYSHADVLRSGSKRIDADNTFSGEVENLGTYNRVITTALNYTRDSHWGAILSLPYIIRDHDHNLGPYVGSSPAGYESFHAAALGDIRLVGRYRRALDESGSTGAGVKFGVKLNTGKKDFTIKQSGLLPEEFALQPGNGSTDLILGLMWYRSTPGSDLNWFAQGTVQASVRADDAYRPGNQINIDGGARYALSHHVSALLQLNAQWSHADSRDSASLTETGGDSSGGRIISLSPGISYEFIRNSQLYALVQVPVYQYMNGEQLTTTSSLSAGVNHRF